MSVDVVKDYEECIGPCTDGVIELMTLLNRQHAELRRLRNWNAALRTRLEVAEGIIEMQQRELVSCR